MNIKQLNTYIEARGGATLTPQLKTYQANNGYMVSLQGYELKTAKLTTQQLKVYKRLAKRNRAFIGFWKNNGIIYIDLSINIHNLNDALKTGRDNNQLAIYDVKNNKSILLY